MSYLRGCRAAATPVLMMLALCACSKQTPVAESEKAQAPAPLQPSTLDVSTLPPLRYAGVIYEAKSGVISPPAAGASPASVKLELQATAPSNAEVPLDGQLTLEFANGAQVRTAARGLGAAQVTDIALAGSVPADTAWNGANLTLSESGKPPQTVAVGAPAPSGDAELRPDVEMNAPTRYGEAVTYTVTQAALLLDGPRSGGFYERTSDTQRFVRIVVTALNKGGRNGVSIGQESFELRADGQSANIAVGVFARTIAYNQSNDFELFYRIPADARTLTLKVGADGRKPAQIVLARPT